MSATLYRRKRRHFNYLYRYYIATADTAEIVRNVADDSSVSVGGGDIIGAGEGGGIVWGGRGGLYGGGGGGGAI